MAITAQLVNELRQKTGAGMMDCKRALTETGGDLDKAVTWLREKGMASAGKRSARSTAEGKVVVAILDSGRGGVMTEVNCETDFVARSEDFLTFCQTALGQARLASKIEELTGQVEEARKQLVAKTGENVQVRRFVRFELPAGAPGRVDIYLHMGGKIGAMVELSAENASVAEHPAFAELAHDVAMQVAANAPTYLDRSQVSAETLEAERAIYLKQGLEEGKPQAVVEKMVEGRVNKWYKDVCLLEQVFVKEQKQAIKDVVKEAATKAGGKIEIRRYARFLLGDGIEKKKSDLAAEVAAQIQATKKG